MRNHAENAKMVGKLAIVAFGMFAFGYALIPLYKRICEATGINILSLTERQVPGNGTAGKDVKLNTQVDTSRHVLACRPYFGRGLPHFASRPARHGSPRCGRWGRPCGPLHPTDRTNGRDGRG